MKIVYNKIIPFKGYKAMALWPFIFVREEYYRKPIGIQHEEIHLSQQKEMLLIPFFAWYVVEYLVRLILYRNHKEAYRNISFEQEAYMNQFCTKYKRKPFAWLKYITKKTFRNNV